MRSMDPSMDYERYPTLAPLSAAKTANLARCGCGSTDFQITLPDFAAVCKECGKRLGKPPSAPIPDVSPAAQQKMLPFSEFQIILFSTAWSNYTIMLRPDGTLRSDRPLPDPLREIADWTNMVAIAAGPRHIAGLRSDGTVTAAGLKAEVLDALRSWSGITAIAATANGVVGLRSDGSVCAVGIPAADSEQLHKWSGIHAVTAAGNRIAGVRQDGTVRAIGDRQDEVYGWERITAVAMDYNRTIALRSNGRIVSIGLSRREREAIADWKSITAITASRGTIAAVDSNKTIKVLLTDNLQGISYAACYEAQRWRGIKSVWVTRRYIAALRTDGFIHCTDPRIQRFIVENLD